MQGPVNEDGSIDYSRRGMIPRTFEYLFERIHEEERKSEGSIAYLCKCTFVEIYNECIYDLLVQDGAVCTLREDTKRGVFVEGCREEVVRSPQEAFMIFEQGSRNRHVAETSMNRESSRSHCVFTIHIQSKQLDGQVMDVRESRFNLVDLAGSERQQYSGTSGMRLKEAGNINKSLLALSSVINALVDIANGKPRHVHYRDSRLTFLLRDSLGGNAKTLIIAAVSPSTLCLAETLSTLRFAQRAKQIKNKAVVNKDIQGNLVELQAEVRKLRSEVLLLKAGQGPYSSLLLDPSSLDDLAGRGRKSGEVYFMLQMALTRQSELLADLNKKQQQIDLLEEQLKKRDQQITSERMVAKFREGTIKALTSRLSEKESCDLLDIFNTERIAELKKQVENHPELTKFAYETMLHRDKLKRLEQYMEDFDEHERLVAKHRKYEDALAERLLRCEAELTELKQKFSINRESRENSMSSLDEVPIRQVCESSEALNLNMVKEEPAHGVMERMQSEMEKIRREKDDLESRYEDLVLEQEILRKELEEARINAEMAGSCTASTECNLFPESDTSEYNVDELSPGKRRRCRDGKEMTDSLEELLDVREELTLKIAILHDENTHLRQELEQLRIDAQNEAQTAFDLSQELLDLKKKYQEASKEAEGRLTEISTQLDALSTMESEKEAFKQESMLLQTALRGTEQQLAETMERLKEARLQITLNHERINLLEAEVERIVHQMAEYAPLKAYGPTTEAIIRRIKQGEQDGLWMQQQIGRLEFMLQNAQQDNEELLDKVHQLEAAGDREKLANAEAMIVALNHELEGLQEELLKLRRENDKLIQHSNVKQKLQYHLQIKEENNHFREEIRQLREELTRLGQRNIELEDLAHNIQYKS